MEAQASRWLNRNIFTFGLTSLLGDICHEMATAVLPQFMQVIGALSDRCSRTGCLAVGYGVAVVTFLGLAFATPSISWLLVCFGLAGVFIAWEETVEGAAVRDYVPEAQAGTAFGMLGVVNGIGDFVSSLAVGLLWSGLDASWGFVYAAVVGLVGTVSMARVRPSGAPET